MLRPVTASGERSTLKRVSGWSTDRVARHSIKPVITKPSASAAATIHGNLLCATITGTLERSGSFVTTAAKISVVSEGAVVARLRRLSDERKSAAV
jgi:hypothetical protein